MIQLRKKGQFWYMDFIMAIIIMSVISLLFIKTVIGMTETKNLLDDILIDAQEISENLISKGILGDGRKEVVQQQAFDYSHEDQPLPATDAVQAERIYSKQKKKLGTNKEFYIYLNDGATIHNNLNNGGAVGIGALQLDDPDVNGFQAIDRNFVSVIDVRDYVSQKVKEKEINNIIELNRLVKYNKGSVSDPEMEIYRLTILVWTRS